MPGGGYNYFDPIPEPNETSVFYEFTVYFTVFLIKFTNFGFHV